MNVCGETRGIARQKRLAGGTRREGCGLGKGEAAFIKVMERAEVQQRMQM